MSANFSILTHSMSAIFGILTDQYAIALNEYFSTYSKVTSLARPKFYENSHNKVLAIRLDLVSNFKIQAHFQKIKYIKNQIYKKMIIIKVNPPFLYSSMKKKLVKIWLIFDAENVFANQNFAVFDLQYQIKPNTQNNFMAVFIDLWPCLLTTKLSYTQLFK